MSKPKDEDLEDLKHRLQDAGFNVFTDGDMARQTLAISEGDPPRIVGWWVKVEVFLTNKERTYARNEEGMR